MTAPIETAFAGLKTALADALVADGFLAAPADLKVDEPAPSEAQAVGVLKTWAALTRGEVTTARTLIGTVPPRYVVELTCELTLVAHGRTASGTPTVESLLSDALAAVAPIAAVNPTLTGACERVELVEMTSEALPPSGRYDRLMFTLRVRSGDPLGRTP